MGDARVTKIPGKEEIWILLTKSSLPRRSNVFPYRVCEDLNNSPKS